MTLRVNINEADQIVEGLRKRELMFLIWSNTMRVMASPKRKTELNFTKQ